MVCTSGHEHRQIIEGFILGLVIYNQEGYIAPEFAVYANVEVLYRERDSLDVGLDVLFIFVSEIMVCSLKCDEHLVGVGDTLSQLVSLCL